MTVVLLRHAFAGHRETWDGEDDWLRPLDARGRAEAEALVAVLAPFEPTRILSSPYTRCLQTVEPLAAALGLVVDVRDELSEERQLADGLALVRSLAGADAIVCTHGGSPWDELVGGRYRKAGAFVLDDESRPVRELAPPA